ncbi:methyl-accepting chemotaxis protein [Geobacter grbiciae]|uniref:methyl-accepting chemotaxis protein n=1 Tax=Geobacter grbiciae TaxID=155042 RepID=UPI001C015837|nr:methyl-accepting chemotaxis protein [Geobacter grbiciae]MBT1076944.1 methyl-accepting chemotaxis protein [Geobacter grbiciae]
MSFKLTIKARIVFIVAFFSAMLIVFGMLGLSGMKAANETSHALYGENMKSVQVLSRIAALMRDNRIQLLLSLQHDPKSEFSTLHDHPLTMHIDIVAKNIEEITALLAEYEKLPKSEEDKKLAAEFKTAREAFVQEGLIPVREAVLAGKYGEGVELTLKKVNPLFKPANEALEKMIKQEFAAAKEDFEQDDKTYRTDRLIMFVGLAGSIAIGVLLSLIIIRSLRRSSEELASVATAVSAGDLTRRATGLSNDELGAIGGSFNETADSFARVIAGIRGNAEQVATAATQVHSTAEQMATGVEEVAAQTGTVATAGEEMAATAAEIAQNCQMAAEAAQRATASATGGATVVQRTVDGMARIADRVRSSARTVESLGSRSEQIGEIIGTIQDIADQTNLLALNAAIEAARAGEQGRGFAVVADEVRALAERTTKATREIGEMIKAIQQETRGAVAAMEEGVHEVEAGTADAQQSGAALQDIMNQINELAMQVSQIATAAEQQTATTGEISGNVQQVSEVVQETAKGIQESAQAASRVAELADELNGLVGRFKVA